MWFNINRNGQLGNRLFSRAHVYAAALEYGETVVDWGLLDVAAKFPRLANTPLPTYPLREDGSMPPLPESFLANPMVLKLLHKTRPRNTGTLGNFWCQNWGSGDPDIARLDTNDFRIFNDSHATIILNGFKMRCPEWVLKHRTEITKFFELPQSLSEKWSIVRQSWKSKFSLVIGVHSRLSDFNQAASSGKPKNNNFIPPHLFAEYIKNNLDFDSTTTVFVIFSDESFRSNARYQEIKDAFHGLNAYINEGDQMDDLCAMMSCDRLIGPSTSTFSRWAAFAAGLPWAGANRMLIENNAPIKFIDTPVPWDY
ncbi:MAG: hypothetical protein NUV50_11085 [Rhodospirillales bacterium]|nr:hypothetical protein [Rhodospirillales bacterium]